MISINDYINNIFQDFSEYVKNSEKLCDLNKKRRKAHSPSIAAGLGGVSFLGY